MTEVGPLAIAMAVLDQAMADRFADIHARLAPALRSLMSPESLRFSWQVAVARLGAPVAVGQGVIESAGGPGTDVVKVPLTFERGDLVLIVSVGPSGEIGGLQLAPVSAVPVDPWEPPPYAKPAAFVEEEVTLGPDRPAAGTLSLPRGPGRWPGLVLLGSGSLDRDETMGRNKPFRDLAWGLASQGVAVLRYDREADPFHGLAGPPPGYTILDRYLPSSRAAVQLLRARDDVDRDRVFVLGHSLAGTVAPRIAALEPGIAGLVILAGGAQPLQWVLVRQMRYLASLDPEAAAASASVLEKVTAQARLVDSADLSTSTPPGDLPLGLPASYWLDMRAYDPVAAAASLGRPILILQGGRDYQATVADDLARWAAGLAGRPTVTIRVYPSDDHLFFSGSGRSSPAEYEPAQHVDGAVVADIADWLRGVG